MKKFHSSLDTAPTTGVSGGNPPKTPASQTPRLDGDSRPDRVFNEPLSTPTNTSKALEKDLSLTQTPLKTPGQTQQRQTRIWPSTIDAAAAVKNDGWYVETVTDSATSRKHSARFMVLTKSVPRATVKSRGDFRSYPSVAAMGTHDGSIVIGFDTEFVNKRCVNEDLPWVGENAISVRQIVSYQFATVDYNDPAKILLCVVIPMEYMGPRGPRVARLSFGKALDLCIRFFKLHDHPLARGWKPQGVPRSEVTEVVGEDSFLRKDRWFKKCKGVNSSALKITLLAHYQHADLTTFVDHRTLVNTWDFAYPSRRKKDIGPGVGGRYRRWLSTDVPDIMRTVISASGGLVTDKPVRMVLDGENHRWARPVELSIRDTMAHSGSQPLAVLGESVGVPKLEVPEDWITRMDEYWEQHPVEFLDYAANDAVVALEYASSVYGDNTALPLTEASWV